MSFFNFITNSSQQIQSLLFVLILILCWNFENLRGLNIGYGKWKHAFTNVPFILTSIPVQILVAFFIIRTIAWTTSHHFGITYLLPHNNPFILFIISFLLLDFGEYFYHRIMHKVKRLWMFHMVHHSDNVVDVSTTFREHPGETFIRLSFTLLWVFLSGSFLWVLALRQIIQVFSTFFAHLNYQLPEKADRIFSILFITPNLHHVHHHYKQPYTDSNYGDVLSIWDRLFGTFRKLPHHDLVFGVDTCMNKTENRKFKLLVVLPFGKYRKRS